MSKKKGVDKAAVLSFTEVQNKKRAVCHLLALFSFSLFLFSIWRCERRKKSFEQMRQREQSFSISLWRTDSIHFSACPLFTHPLPHVLLPSFDMWTAQFPAELPVCRFFIVSLLVLPMSQRMFSEQTWLYYAEVENNSNAGFLHQDFAISCNEVHVVCGQVISAHLRYIPLQCPIIWWDICGLFHFVITQLNDGR